MAEVIYEHGRGPIWNFRVLCTDYRYTLEFSSSQGQYVTPATLREAADAIEAHQEEARYRNAIREVEALLRDGISNPVLGDVVRFIWDISNRALGHTPSDDGFSYYVDRAKGLEEVLGEIRDAILAGPTTGDAMTTVKGIVGDALKGDR